MNKIEQVARALLRSKRSGNHGYPEGWLALHPEEHWRLHVDDARAAIEAMREPTDQMIWEGGTEMHDKQEDSKGIYQAMIDEALK